ncbi:hypothetical protein TNCV_4701921 [Trichonephila clavipes]|uniref:Uncharacterized protein n=1 Tax=Trichonephila clavipes TaxID=2585209 RepID=A0A8X7BK05_TRICX|nr:hypothetical protein TNCV_4701921 [Trichonephila clavipes]
MVEVEGEERITLAKSDQPIICGSIPSLQKGPWTLELAKRGTPIDADLREQILKLGSYQPEGNFQKDAKGRSFSSSYYSFISKAGQKIQRKWLCCSTRLHVDYCQLNVAVAQSALKDWCTIKIEVRTLGRPVHSSYHILIIRIRNGPRNMTIGFLILEAQYILAKRFLQALAKPRVCHPTGTLIHHLREPVSTYIRSNFEAPCTSSTEQRDYIL